MSDANEPIGLTVHSLPSPQQMLQRRRTAHGRLKTLIVLLVCAAPVLASYFTYFVIRPSAGSGAYSSLIRPSLSTPELLAHRLDGSAVALRSFKGQWLLIAVHGGDCAPACQKRLFMQRQLRDMTGRERERIDKLWLVIDDAAVNPALSGALQATPGMHILRVPRAALAAWLRPEPGRALEEHLYIVDPMGEWMMRVPADADPARVKRDIDRLLRASASWDQPGR